MSWREHRYRGRTFQYWSRRQVAALNLSLLRDDATKLGLHPRIVATDMNRLLAPACLAADVSYDVPPTRDKSFIPSLCDICQREGVRLLVPTIDLELQPLARNRAAFMERHVFLNISNLTSLVVAQDKAKTARVLSEAGIVVPKTASIKEAIAAPSSWTWPVFVKPASGSSSIGVSQAGVGFRAKEARKATSGLDCSGVHSRPRIHRQRFCR